MKKIPLLLTLGFVLLTIGGITLYQYFFNREKLSIWDLIPQQTVLVYEIDNCESCRNQKGSTIEQIIERVIFDFQDSTKKALEILSTPKKGNAVSMHVTSKSDFDLIFYFSEDQGSEFDFAINSWKRNKERRSVERELNGTKIQEFNFDRKLLSCVKLDKIWVASFTPFLIEDVIRTYTSGDKSTFISDISSVQSLPRIKGDPGNLYIHLENFVSWLEVFYEDGYLLPSIGKASLLDIKQDNHSLTLNGFSLTAETKKSSLLTYFERQSPIQFGQKQFISNRTILATNFGISDGLLLYKNLELANNKSIRDTLVALANTDFEKIFTSFGKELSLCYQESKNGRLSKVILFETAEPKSWLDAFDRFSKAVEKGDTVFFEKYSTYEIREIEMHDFPGKLFRPLVSGFDQTYYTWMGNTIFLTDQLEVLKQFIDDIDQENVWGKSVAFNKFFESTLLESNVSIYFNTPLVWNTLSNRLNPRWKKFIMANQSLLNSLDMGAIQFSHLNNSFYTNALWTFSDLIPYESADSKKSERLVANVNSPIINSPFVNKSHVSKEDEVLIQDSLFTLHHLSSNGKVLWSVLLDGPIIGEVKQVDFFNNGKLQFFFATSKKLHVIDRLGKYVAPFPVEFKIKDLQYVSLVDYDNSKKYRFLLADKSGRLWMYDKGAQNLEGWKPKSIGGELFTNAKHHRIRGKDYIVAIQKDGWAHVMNRRGEYVKGFPLNLDARPEGDYYVEIGNTMASTNFACVSKDGFRIKFSLEGKVLSRETLVKPSFDTQFGLVAEHHNKSYLIKRQDAKRLVLLSEEGAELVSNDFVGFNPVAIRYYDFSAGKIFISITDLTQDISFIYDGKGKLLTPTPVVGSSIELRPGKSDLPKTFIVDGNTLIIQ